jgi:hypothetical protein
MTLEVLWYGRWRTLDDAVTAHTWSRPGFSVMSFHTRQFRADGRLVEVGSVGQSPNTLKVRVR